MTERPSAGKGSAAEKTKLNLPLTAGYPILNPQVVPFHANQVSDTTREPVLRHQEGTNRT